MRVISSTHYKPSTERGVVFHTLTRTTLAGALAGATHVLQQTERGQSGAGPHLMAFCITEPAICLGRFQNPQIALDAAAANQFPVMHRLTGGPACWVAPGTFYFCAILPDWQTQLNPILPRTPTRALQKAFNDAFRNAFKSKGFLLTDSANTLCYTRQGQEVARMGMDLTAKGVLVGEWFLAASEKLELPAGLQGYATNLQEAHPAPGCLRDLQIPPPEDFEPDFARAFGETLLGANACSVQTGEFTYLDRMRIDLLVPRMRAQSPAAPEGVPLYTSLLHEESIGFIHAQVAFNPRLQFSYVSIGGDFVADSPGIALLENRLRFTDVNKRNIALIIDEVLGAPEHFILGVKRLGTLLDAILDAAARNDAWNVTQA